MEMLQRGEISRPGDNSNKIFYLNKEEQIKDKLQKQSQKLAIRKEKGLKSKNHRNRLFAIFLLEKFGPLSCVDVAGGSGELTRALLNRGFTSIVVDPRKDTKKCGEGIQQIFELFDHKNVQVREICSQKQLLLGLHPDGAVNFIVDFKYPPASSSKGRL